MSTTTNYIVTGMTCGHCANHVTQEVKGLPGVADVRVDVAGPMAITSDDVIDFELVRAAVSEAGDYTVALA